MVIELIRKISELILNPLITLAFVIAFVVFFYGIVEFVASETADGKREQGKKKIMYGLLGMLIMFSAYGIIAFLLTTFGIDKPDYLF